MNRFADTLEEILKPANKEAISKELAALDGQHSPLRKFTSKIMTEIIAEAFPTEPIIKPTKSFLLKIWEGLVRRASKKVPPPAALWTRIFTGLNSVLRLIYIMPRTLAKSFTIFRNCVTKKYGVGSVPYELSIKYMNDTKEAITARRQEYEEEVTQAGLNRRSQTIVYDVTIYKIIDYCFDSKNVYEMIIGAMLTTGSRLVEVIKVSQYSAVSADPTNESPINQEYLSIFAGATNLISIRGLAKERGNVSTIVRPLIRKTTTEVLDLINRLRMTANTEGDNQAATGRIDPRVNDAIRRLFSAAGLGNGWTSHSLRYISANLAYLLYGNGATEVTWLQKYLGHKNIENTRIYQSINVKLATEEEAKTLDGGAIIINRRRVLGLERPITDDIEYPELVNLTPHHSTRTEKFAAIRRIYQRAAEDGIRITNANLRKKYRYGGDIISDFNRLK